MQVSAVNNKYKNQDEDDYELVDESSANENSDSESTDTDGFSLSGALKMVAGGKSAAKKNEALTSNASEISKKAIAFSKDAAKGVKDVRGEVTEFERFMAEQERVAAAEQAQIDAICSQIDADAVTLEALFADSESPSGAPAYAPAAPDADPSELDDSSNSPARVSSSSTGCVDTTGDTDNSSEADTLLTRISSNQANVYTLIANSTRRSRTSENRSRKIRSSVNSKKNAIKKSVSDQKNADNKTKSILKTSQTVSTVGSSITIAGYIGKAVGWAMNATGVAAAAGTAIITACKTVVIPAGDLVFGVGKAGECAADVELGDKKAALIAGGESLLSFVSFASEVKVTADAIKTTKDMTSLVTAHGGAINKAAAFANNLKSASTAAHTMKIGKMSVDTAKVLGYAKKATHLAEAYTVGAQVMKKGS